jgi:hypothetical protein
MPAFFPWQKRNGFEEGRASDNPIFVFAEMNPQLATVQHRQSRQLCTTCAASAFFMKLLGSPLTTRCRRAPKTMKLGFSTFVRTQCVQVQYAIARHLLDGAAWVYPNADGQQSRWIATWAGTAIRWTSFTHNFYRRLTWALDSKYSNHTTLI